MQSSQSNQSNGVTTNGTNSYSLNGYNISYDGSNLKVTGNGQSQSTPMMNNSTEYVSSSNGKLSISFFSNPNSFAKATLNNGSLSVVSLMSSDSSSSNKNGNSSGGNGSGNNWGCNNKDSKSGNSSNGSGKSSSGNGSSSASSDLVPLMLAINDELENIKNILPLKAFMSIDKNIGNIIKAMALANFKETKNPDIYSGLKWVIYGVYYNENLDLLTTPMTSSNVSSWQSPVPLTNPVYSGCSYNFLNYVVSTTSTNTSGVNAIADNTGQAFFTVVWYGYFMPNVSGNWTFQTATDDGSYLWVNSDSSTPITNFDSFSTSNLSACGITLSNALVNNGQTHGVVTKSASSSFTAGELYPIIILAGQTEYGYSCAVTVTDPNNTEYSSNCAYIFGNYISN